MDSKNKRGGYRLSGNGRFILLNDFKVILSGEFQRPNEGLVDNKGNFIIVDWLFGDGLNGIMYAITKKGEIILKEKVNANILNIGMSNNGKYAALQTLNNNEDSDGNKLFFFNIESRNKLWKKTPETGWADKYSFDEKLGILYAEFNDGRSYRYDIDGNFLDFEKWEKDLPSVVSGYELLDFATKKIKLLKESNASSEEFFEIINLIKLVLDKEVSNYTQARVYRIIGELYLRMDLKEKAADNFKIALELNPKVGVKREFERLVKDLG